MRAGWQAEGKVPRVLVHVACDPKKLIHVSPGLLKRAFCSSEEAQVRKFSGLKVLLFSWCLSNVNPDASAQPILLLQQGETPVLKAEVQTGPCCPQHPALPSPLSCKPHSSTTGLLGAWMKYSPHSKENTMKYI